MGKIKGYEYWINNRNKYDNDIKFEYMKFLLGKIKWNRLPVHIRDYGYEKLISYMMEKEWYYNALYVTRDMDQYNIGPMFRREFNEIKGKNIFEDFTSVMEVLTNFALESECSGYYRPGVKSIDVTRKTSREADDIHWHPEAFFFEMLINMGLDFYDDDHFNPYQVDFILDSWMRREYSSKGYGSPFPLDLFDGYYLNNVLIEDVREIDVYTQRQLYDLENADRYLKYLYKPRFYDNFMFKVPKKVYLKIAEKAKKIEKFNRYPGSFW